ncbi:MAG: alpha/beta hydrolase [Chryseolinea sp.]
MLPKIKSVVVLFILAKLLSIGVASAQIPYGSNPKAGAYLNVGDAKIYYEVYGTGKTVVLLHGGLFGYIDEYQSIIPSLAKQYQVLLIATRGHGKSEIGTATFSYKQFAEDAYKVIRNVTNDSVRLIGFSDGADQGYYLATSRPETVSKFVAIGGNWGAADFNSETREWMNNLNGKAFEKNFAGFVTERKKLMPEPHRFAEFVDKLAAVWKADSYVSPEVISSINCQTMIMAGETDSCPVERYVDMYRKLKKGSLAIIPGSNHLVLEHQPKLVEDIILRYFK